MSQLDAAIAATPARSAHLIQETTLMAILWVDKPLLRYLVVGFERKTVSEGDVWQLQSAHLAKTPDECLQHLQQDGFTVDANAPWRVGRGTTRIIEHLPRAFGHEGDSDDEGNDHD